MEWSVDRMDFEARNDKAKATDATVTAPDALKSIGHKAWIPFWRHFQNYCRTIRGTLNIPIVYVFRDSTAPTLNLFTGDFSSSDDALISNVTLRGKYFNEDNARVWNILETLTCNGNAWSFIKHFKNRRDGRGAILVLKGQCEGAASLEVRKKTAYLIIKDQIYDGKGRFTWDQYVEKLQFAFA